MSAFQLFLDLAGTKLTEESTEVVLTVLLSTFKFELTDKRIYWNLAPFVYPSVVPYGSKPELPLKVTLLDRDTIGESA